MSTSDPGSTLALLIHLLVSYDHEAELARIELAEEKDLDLFHYYRKIDRSKNGFISKNDLAIFLNAYGVFLPGRISERFFREGRGSGPRITYNDFINQMLPYSAPDLKRQCLAKSGDTETEYSQTQERTMEAKIATIYSKEAELSSQIQEALNSAPKDLDIDELVFSLCDELSGYLDLRKIQEFMNYNGYEFDSLGYEYLVRRLCVNQVGRISPSDFLRHLFPDKFIKPKVTKTEDDTYAFKFSKKPFTITQRPASATKAKPAFEQTPLNFVSSSSIYGTQPKRPINTQHIASPLRPINFPDLNQIPVNEMNPEPTGPTQTNLKAQAPNPQYSIPQETKETFQGDKFSSAKFMNDSRTTGKFPNNPAQPRATDESQTSSRTEQDQNSDVYRSQQIVQNINPTSYLSQAQAVRAPYPERPSSQNMTYNQGVNSLEANRIESFGIANNADLVSRLNTNVQPSTYQSKYTNIKPPGFQGQETVGNQDYKQGFYTTNHRAGAVGNPQTVGSNHSPLFSAPLKYNPPLRESDSNAYGEYRASLNAQASQVYSAYQGQNNTTTQASNYNPPLRFYSPKYTRDSAQPQTNTTENTLRYSVNAEQRGVKYAQPLTQYVPTQNSQNPTYTSYLSYNAPLDTSKKSWQEKLEMSRKITGDATYKFSNNAYDKIWHPDNEQ